MLHFDLCVVKPLCTCTVDKDTGGKQTSEKDVPYSLRVDGWLTVPCEVVSSQAHYSHMQQAS